MPGSRFLNGAEASRRYGVAAGTCAASLRWADPLADAAAEALHPFHERWWAMVCAALEMGTGKVPEAPPELGALIAALPAEPAIEQWTEIEAGRMAVARAGNGAALILECASLLMDCWSPPLARALMLTGDHSRPAGDGPAQIRSWWIELHRRGGLHRSGEGFKATLQLRLVHAFMRRLARSSAAWDREAWGEPINQADLFFRVVACSWFVIDGLQRMGFKLSNAEKDGYFVLWRYTASVLGVEHPYLQLLDAEGCENFWHLWILTSPGPDQETFVLAGRTLGGSADLRSRLRRAMLCTTANRLLGREIGDRLGVPHTWLTGVLPHLTWPAMRLLNLRSSDPGGKPLAAPQALATWSPQQLQALAGFRPARPSI